MDPIASSTERLIRKSTTRIFQNSNFYKKIINYIYKNEPFEEDLINYMKSLVPELTKNIYSQIYISGSNATIDAINRSYHNRTEEFVHAEIYKIIHNQILEFVLEGILYFQDISDIDDIYDISQTQIGYYNFGDIIYRESREYGWYLVVNKDNFGRKIFSMYPYINEKFIKEFEFKRDPYFKYQKSNISYGLHTLEEIIPSKIKFNEIKLSGKVYKSSEISYNKLNRILKSLERLEPDKILTQCDVCNRNFESNEFISKNEKNILFKEYPEYKYEENICRECYRNILIGYKSRQKGVCTNIITHEKALADDPERLRTSFIIGMSKGIDVFRKYMRRFLTEEEIARMSDEELIEYADNL